MQVYEPNYLLIFGNEFSGIPAEHMQRSDARIVIPMLGQGYDRPDPSGLLTNPAKQRCLALSASISIVLFHAVQQLTGFRGWRDF